MIDVDFYSVVYDISAERALEHWKHVGRDTGLFESADHFYKTHSEFDWKTHVKNNLASIETCHNWEYAAIKHFLHNNNIDKNVFDPTYYTKTYPDIQMLNPKFYSTVYSDVSKSEATRHWNIHGVKEGRLPSMEYFYKKYPDFQWEEYLKMNPDLNINLSQPDEAHAITHYYQHGAREGRRYKKSNEIKSPVKNKKNFVSNQKIDLQLNDTYTTTKKSTKTSYNTKSVLLVVSTTCESYIKVLEILKHHGVLVKVINYRAVTIDDLDQYDTICWFDHYKKSCITQRLDKIHVIWFDKVKCKPISITNSNLRVVSKQQWDVQNHYMINFSSNDDMLKLKVLDIFNIFHSLLKEIAIVTCITGQYDEIQNFDTQHVNRIVYTDIPITTIDELPNTTNVIIDDVEKYLNFTGVHANDKLYTNITRDMMLAKSCKINHHLLRETKHYNYTIWLDGRGFVKDMILLKWHIYEMLSQQYNVSVFNHSRWDNLFTDGIYCKNYSTLEQYSYLKPRYGNQNIIEQLIEYLPDVVENNVYFECGFIIRKNKCEHVINFFNNWWYHNIIHTFQDQLSFSYLLHNSPDVHNFYIGDNIYNNQYILISSHAKDSTDKDLTNMVLSANKREVVSYDFWDTLCGRICYDNIGLFHIMEHRLKITGFAKLRIQAEINVSKTNTNYSLSEIYNEFLNMCRCDISKYLLCLYEQLTEISMIFFIRKHASRLDDNSIIVSDFFWDHDQFVKFLDMIGIYINHKQVFVTNDGKRDGYVWEKLQNKTPFQITKHVGNNKWSDYDNVKIKTSIVPECVIGDVSLTDNETYMHDHGFPLIGSVMRSVRLSNMYKPDGIQHKIWNIYCDRYLPVLLIQALVLNQLQDSATKFTFMARDVWMLMNVFKVLFPTHACQYYYTSRNAMNHADCDYVEYSRAVLDGSIVVDLLGTGNTFTAFCKKHNIDYGLYIVWFASTGGYNVLNYYDDTKMYHVCNFFNKYIERLNYSWHGSVHTACKDSVSVYDAEYDVSLYDCLIKLNQTLTDHVFKVSDVMSTYHISNENIFKIVKKTLEPLGSSAEEASILNMIGHENDHDISNGTIEHKLNTQYYIDNKECYKFINNKV